MSNDYNRTSRVTFSQVMNIRLLTFTAETVFVQSPDEISALVTPRWIG